MRVETKHCAGHAAILADVRRETSRKGDKRPVDQPGQIALAQHFADAYCAPVASQGNNTVASRPLPPQQLRQQVTAWLATKHRKETELGALRGELQRAISDRNQAETALTWFDRSMAWLGFGSSARRACYEAAKDNVRDAELALDALQREIASDEKPIRQAVIDWLRTPESRSDYGKLERQLHETWDSMSTDLAKINQLRSQIKDECARFAGLKRGLIIVSQSMADASNAKIQGWQKKIDTIWSGKVQGVAAECVRLMSELQVREDAIMSSRLYAITPLQQQA